MHIAIANIGTRDVTTTFGTDEEKNTRPRERGDTLLKLPPAQRGGIKFPILEPTLQHIINQHTETIDRLILFATDQERTPTNSHHHANDTINYAKLAQAILPTRFGRRLNTVDIIPIDSHINPSRYDQALPFFETQLHKIAQQHPHTITQCYLLTTGGIPACNTAILFHGMTIFAEKALHVHQSEDADPLSMLLSAQTRHIALEHLRRFDFPAVAATLQSDLSPTTHHLLNYGTARLHFNFSQAADHLTQAAATLTPIPPQLTRWQAELKQLDAADPKSLLHELYHNGRISWEQHRYVDFVIRARRFQQIALTHLAETQPPTSYLLQQLAEGVLNTANDSWDTTQKQLLRQILITAYNLEELKTICFNLDIDHERLRHAQKDELVLDLISYADRRGLLAALLTASREVNPQATWEKLDNPPDNQRRFYRSLLRLNQLAEQLNQTILGSGRGGITAEMLTTTEKNGETITPIQDMAAVCQQLTIPLKNPFRELQTLLHTQLTQTDRDRDRNREDEGRSL